MGLENKITKTLENSDIFKTTDETVVSISKEYITFMVVLQLFYNKKLSDINLDLYEGTDLMLVTGRKGEEFHKFLFVYKKDSYTKEEKEIIEHAKENNIKNISVSFKPTELITFLFQGLVNKFRLHEEQQTDLYQKDTFYDFLVKTGLNDNSLYVVDGYVKQNNEITKINVNKNNRVNLFMATRKIKEGLIKKIFGLVLRPNYTNLKFDDIKDSMLTLYKLEELIYDFLTGGWEDMLKREKSDFYSELLLDDGKKRNFGKKILNDFFVLCEVLNIRISDGQIELLEKAQNATEEQKKEMFKNVDLFGSNLKGKDDISKFFTALESGSSLVLVTGPTGSGKTTYLMTGLQELLQRKVRNVVTLEDPVEFLLVNEKGLVYQREVNKDISDYVSGIKDALRQKPHIIVLGEIRESKKENLAKQLIEAAKTGHLILGTMHATNLYDGYQRFKSLAETEETFLNYMINLRRFQMLNNQYLNVYSHYIYDKTKDNSTSEKEMMAVDKGLYGTNFKLIMLFLIGMIDVNTLTSNASDLGFVSKEISKIKNNNYIDEMYSEKNKIRIELLSGNAD